MVPYFKSSFFDMIKKVKIEPRLIKVRFKLLFMKLLVVFDFYLYACII